MQLEEFRLRLVENMTKTYCNETGELITRLVHPQQRIENHKSCRKIDRHFLEEISQDPDNLRLDCEYCSDRSKPVEKGKKNKKKIVIMKFKQGK